ncbi:hypothetical protein MKS88_000851 [Plasmodium brasilianum]|uniref:Uncharacterized protein n=1 Tax=Plasmodium brasilianum TaxID=5824 RepID=A0ACB9YGL1_PLABR|nr:hypothetical protein MKS88_000851 [Plasmodium brasilianum]
MNKMLLKFIFDELCTSFNKKDSTNTYSKKKDDNDNNEINYIITLQDLFENLERNKNMYMDIYMKKEVLENIYHCRDICIIKQEKKKAELDEYNNDVDIKIDKGNQNLIINSANHYNVCINNIYIYNKHNLFYYQRIKECKEKIFILLYIISGKYNGFIQSSLSRSLNLDVKIVHYHLKALFQFLLIKKISINISNLEKSFDNSNNRNSSNSNTIKLNPTYILYFNIYFIYNLLPIFIKNILYSQNVLSINKIIVYLLNKFIIIPQKVLSFIFFKLLIVYNPYYFIQVRKALRLFNSILSSLINKKKIIMCKIKVHSNYENCYLNYENKDKINYDNIINFLLLFYYNYDYLIKFINKSCYLMCEDYVKRVEFKNEFVKGAITTTSAWNELGMYLKRSSTFGQSIQQGKNIIHLNSSSQLPSDLPSNIPSDIQDIVKIEYHNQDVRKNGGESKETQIINNIKREEDNIYINEKNCNLLINEFENYVGFSTDNKTNDTDYYSSSPNENQESSLSEFSFFHGNEEIEESVKQTSAESEQNENIEEVNKKYLLSHASSTSSCASSSSTSSTNTNSDGKSYNNYFIKNKNICLNNLSLYNKIKYLILSKGVNGMTTKEISQILLLSVKKINTFLCKLIRNKDIVKIPERKNKSFMYRFIDNNIYHYLQKNPHNISLLKMEKQENNTDHNNSEINGEEDEKETEGTIRKNASISKSDKTSDNFYTVKNKGSKNVQNKNVNELTLSEKEKEFDLISEKKDFSHIQFNKLSESLNVLNYINTVNKIDINVLMYVIPKYKDSVNNFSNFKDFFDNYVENFKKFEDKYDLYTCSFHFFYYLKFLLKKDQTKHSSHKFSDLHDSKSLNKPSDVAISEQYEKEFYIKNIDSSEKNIDFIKYFMEDTTKLKSNLFIKRLFIFCHFLLCSKVTTFRYLQDLFIMLENSGRTIDRKSVQRLFNYSTKINQFFKKYTLLNSKTVKYYFYDSYVLSEKQSNELYAKFQQEYALFFYRHNNTTDKSSKGKMEYYNLTNTNIASNKLKYMVKISDKRYKAMADSSEASLYTQNDSNRINQIADKNNVENYNLHVEGKKEEHGHTIFFAEKNEQSSTQNPSNRNDNSHVVHTITNKKDTTGGIYNLPGGSSVSSSNRSSSCYNGTSSEAFSNLPYHTSLMGTSVDTINLSNKRKFINPVCKTYNKKRKSEQLHKINENKTNMLNKLPSQDTFSCSYKTCEEPNLEDKDEIQIVLSPLRNKNHGKNVESTSRDNHVLAKNSNECNVLYIDILNESAFKCKESKIVSKRVKTRSVFRSFKTPQEFSYGINYFNGYIFSKMARYKYFHKCLIRILKKKKKKIKKQICPEEKTKDSCSNRGISSGSNIFESYENISKKRKIDYIESNQKKRKKKKKSNLPPILFEFLTSYSLLNCNKNNIIQNFLSSRNEQIYLNEINPYEQLQFITFSNCNSNDCLRKHDDDVAVPHDDDTVSNPNNDGEERLKKNYLYSSKKKNDVLSKHDMNVIKSSDRISIFYFLYRKLKFLYNMNLVHLKFSNNMKKNASFPHKWKGNVSCNSKNAELNISFVDIKKNNLRIYIKKYVNIHLFTPKKSKRENKTYNIMRYNHFEEFYYNLYISVERFKKFLPDAYFENYPRGKLTLQDVLKNCKIKNKNLKFLLFHNSYTNQLFLTRKLRKMFLSLTKKVKKREISKSKLMEELASSKEYDILRNIYNISRTNIEKYFTVFYDIYSKEKSSVAITDEDLLFSCPFCNNIFSFKNDLLSHISTFHNVNKKFSNLISFFSNSKHMIHKNLSDFLRIKNRIVKNANIYPDYNFSKKRANAYETNSKNVKNASYQNDILHQNNAILQNNIPYQNKPWVESSQHFSSNSISDQKLEKPEQAIQMQSYDLSAKEENLLNEEFTNLKKKKKNVTNNLEKADEEGAYSNNFYVNKNYKKYINDFLENVKVKHTLKIVYIYFVTTIVQLVMSEKNLEKERKNIEIQTVFLDKTNKSTENSSTSTKELLLRKKKKTVKGINKNEGNSVVNPYKEKDVNNLLIKKKITKLQKKRGLLESTIIQSEKYESQEKKKKKKKCYKEKSKKVTFCDKILPSYFKTSESVNDFISTKLNKFRLIYYLKNKTNGIPYKKYMWNEANRKMIGKFKPNVCIYIQKKLFYYFKKNIIHYFFILSNENFARCILSYSATHIYNCTYTNINYYYDKYIKNIYNFKFISLVNLLKLFIINYGDQFTAYKEIIKPLFFQKIEDIKNSLRFLKKKSYVIDTSYILSNYISSDLICDNIYANLVYKSMFYKKKLSLFSKKSFFDNVLDMIYLMGVSHSVKLLEGEHFEKSNEKKDNTNYHLKGLLSHIDAVYDEEHNQAIPYNSNNTYYRNAPKNCIYLKKDIPFMQNGYKNVDYNKELNEDVSQVRNNNIYDFNYTLMKHCTTNNVMNNEDNSSENPNEECKKHYFNKRLTIFDLYYCVHNFLKGNIILYACNNYILTDENECNNDEKPSDREKDMLMMHNCEKDSQMSNFSDVSHLSEAKKFVNYNKHNNLQKKNEKNLKNGEYENRYKEDDKSMSYTSSTADESDIFDHLSDDYEIIKLLENSNDGNKKILGGISKHINCLTKHVSEYFPNYYFLNSFEKKKLEKKLSQIFSNTKEVKFSNSNHFFHHLYYDPNYINNSLFSYFKRYCLYIYENDIIMGQVPYKPFKNSFLLNISDTNNVNFTNLFNAYMQENNFSNSIIYKKNKLLIYNINKKTFIDYDLYPQNMHLYNIAFMSNVHKNVDSLLDVQVSNLKNSVFWLEKDKSKRKKKKKKKKKNYEQTRGKTVWHEPPFNDRKTENSQKNDCMHTDDSNNNMEIGKKGETPKKIPCEIKKKERSKSNAHLKNFVKKVNIKGNRTKNNTYKESFFFVTRILYDVFYINDILNIYGECGNYKDNVFKKKQKKIITVSEKIRELYKCKNDKMEECNANRSSERDFNMTHEYNNVNREEEQEEVEKQVYYTEENFESNEWMKDTTSVVTLLNSKNTNNHNKQETPPILNSANYDIVQTEKNYTVFNKIINKMLFVFLSIKKKKENGRFIDSLKKMYLLEFMKNTNYSEYSNVKKEYDFIIFLLNKLNLIKIFPFMNTHKIFLAQYHYEINAYKRKNMFYEHNYKHPFLNMINCHLKNFKFQFKKYTDSETKIFKKFMEKSEITNYLDIKKIGVSDNANEKYSSERYVYKKNIEEKLIYNREKLNYVDCIFINFINNNTLKKPNFVPRLILLFNLQCSIIIHDFFFMYLLDNFHKIQKLKKGEIQSQFEKNNTIFHTKIGNKLLHLIENKRYAVVIKYIRRIINRACKYFESILYLYKKKNEPTFKKKLTIYYFNDNYINANSFIYANGNTNIKFVFFYVLKVFFYLKNNPYSSIFDMYKSVEILNFCDLSFLLRAMCQDNFISFKLMYVSKRSEMYKLKKNYKIINDFNNLIANEHLKIKKKVKKNKNITCDLFESTTSSEGEFTTEDNLLKNIIKNENEWRDRNEHKYVRTINYEKPPFEESRKDNSANLISFIDKMMYKKIKLYYVEDENLIFKKYAGTLWN